MNAPSRRGLLRAGCLGGLAALGSASARPARAAPVVPSLRRGISLWPWFSLTREFPPPSRDYGWPAFQTDRPVPTRDDLRRLRAAGFDFVRLPLDPGPFVALNGTNRLALRDELDRAVEAVRAADLALVLNVQANGRPMSTTRMRFTAAGTRPCSGPTRRSSRTSPGATAATAASCSNP